MLRFRKIWACSLAVVAAWAGLGYPALAAADAGEWPVPDAAGLAVIEAHTGQVLFTANGAAPLPPASTGKIVTALLTLELVDDLSETATISLRAAAVPEASINLRAGEVLSLADLLTGALVHSGNDACFALAEAVAGSEPLFVHWLNMKCAVLGAYSARLTNTNGLPDEEHRISAADLAKLTAYAMRHEFFAETVASKGASFGQGASFRYYRNTNKLLWQDDHIVGVKTGTTDAAGPCLVAAYQDGAALYISAVFNTPDRYGSSLELLKFAAANYALLWPIQAGQAVACWPEAGADNLLYAAKDVKFLVPETEREGIRAVWELPYRVRFFSADGSELGATDLVRQQPGRE